MKCHNKGLWLASQAWQRTSRWVITIAVWLLLGYVYPTAAPAASAQTAPLKRLSVQNYPLFSDEGDVGPLCRSIEMSVAYLKQLPPNRQIHFGADPYTVSHLLASLEEFSRIISAKPPSRQLNRIIRERFFVYEPVGRDGNVLYTGYYEPLLTASTTQTPEFKTPVHPKPQDMVEIDLSRFASDLKGRAIVGRIDGQKVVPYPSRKEIRAIAAFNEIAPPLAWLRDEIDLVTLQIQGSGRVKLTDGTQRHLLYDGSNGRPYRSIGRLLIDEGRIPAERMSMPAICRYLRKHPEIAERIIDHNPRYIFFRTAQQGPLGALGQPLTPRRSIAVDRSIFPSAALAFVTVRLPRVNRLGEVEEGHVYHRGFALAQDAGSAIKGPGRVDLFMGHGRQAELVAGHLKNTGGLYLLILKPN